MAGVLDVTLSILALIAAGVTLELFVAGRTPRASEEQPDFRLPPETRRVVEESRSGNPS